MNTCFNGNNHQTVESTVPVSDWTTKNHIGSHCINVNTGMIYRLTTDFKFKVVFIPERYNNQKTIKNGDTLSLSSEIIIQTVVLIN